MEDRIATPNAYRPGAAVIALAVILAVTAAWWALALWPLGTVQAAWIERTRAACFGAMPGGLPDAGGWILLVGEPIGMVAALMAIWGRSLKRDLAAVRGHPIWQGAGVIGILLLLVGAGALATRVARAATGAREAVRLGPGVPRAIDRELPVISLVEQHGRETSLADFRGHPTLLTFAFGHCAEVCPTTVHDILSARRGSGRADVPLVVLTLDPWRDTPERLATIATSWGLAPGDRVLSGSVSDVEQALDQLGVWHQRDETTGDLSHSATAMLVDARGHIRYRFDGGLATLAQLLRTSR